MNRQVVWGDQGGGTASDWHVLYSGAGTPLVEYREMYEKQ